MKYCSEGYSLWQRASHLGRPGVTNHTKRRRLLEVTFLSFARSRRKKKQLPTIFNQCFLFSQLKINLEPKQQTTIKCNPTILLWFYSHSVQSLKSRSVRTFPEEVMPWTAHKGTMNDLRHGLRPCSHWQPTCKNGILDPINSHDVFKYVAANKSLADC